MHHREQFRQYLAESPFLSAPMADYTDRAFREIMRDMGARLIHTEMYSSEAIARGDPKTDRLMDFGGETPPVIVQLLGQRPDLMAESARGVERLGAQGIDINMGCPARKVVHAGGGAALAENFPRAVAVVRAVRAATPLPVTVKMRWMDQGRTLRLAQACEAEGADAIALHARTRAQAYGGTAHWPWIAELKRALGVPVIGNGDVLTAADAWRMRRETGCDAVMAGRGLVGNAWLMREAMAALRSEDYTAPDSAGPPTVSPAPSDADRLALCWRHGQLMFEHKGQHGLIEFRKHAARYILGLPGARAARPELMQVLTVDQLFDALHRHFPVAFGQVNR